MAFREHGAQRKNLASKSSLLDDTRQSHFCVTVGAFWGFERMEKRNDRRWRSIQASARSTAFWPGVLNGTLPVRSPEATRLAVSQKSPAEMPTPRAPRGDGPAMRLRGGHATGRTALKRWRRTSALKGLCAKKGQEMRARSYVFRLALFTTPQMPNSAATCNESGASKDAAKERIATR